MRATTLGVDEDFNDASVAEDYYCFLKARNHAVFEWLTCMMISYQHVTSLFPSKYAIYTH